MINRDLSNYKDICMLLGRKKEQSDTSRKTYIFLAFKKIIGTEETYGRKSKENHRCGKGRGEGEILDKQFSVKERG